MFHTARSFYPHGIEGESMGCTFKSFDIIEKAIEYCHRYRKGRCFAGVDVTDDEGRKLYEITCDQEVNDYRNEVIQ
jgi:hypothetical protein